MRYLDWILGSWLLSDSTVAIAAFWGVYQQTKDLSLSFLCFYASFTFPTFLHSFHKTSSLLVYLLPSLCFIWKAKAERDPPTSSDLHLSETSSSVTEIGKEKCNPKKPAAWMTGSATGISYRCQFVYEWFHLWSSSRVIVWESRDWSNFLASSSWFWARSSLVFAGI